MRQKLEIFDLDRTLVKKTTAFCFYFHLLKKRIMKRRTLLRAVLLYFRARFGNLSIKELHRKVFLHILQGHKLSLFVEEAKLFLDLFLPRNLNPLIHLRFLKAKEEGCMTYLLSSSPDFLVREIASRMGFDFWKGTEYAVDKDGHLCEISSLIEGHAKLQAAKKIPCGEATAYSDSMDDLPLLEWAKHAVVVQASRNLKRLAREKKWEVL